MDYDVLKNQIAKVNKAFYDAVYKDPWLSLVFKGVKQEFIESQQTDFMLGAFGGPKNYSGRSPAQAHPHINVTEEMWQLREKYLREAFALTQVSEEIQNKWIKIDEAFKHAIVKKSVAECEKRYFTDEIIDVPNTTNKDTKKVA